LPWTALNSACSASSPASCARRFSPPLLATFANFMELLREVPLASYAPPNLGPEAREYRVQGPELACVLTKCYSSPPQSNSNENEAVQPSRRNDVSWLSMSRHHCTRRPRLPLAGRLFSRQPSSLREASTLTAAAPDPGEFSETGSATCQEASRSDRCDRSATASATCQEASSTDQNEFGEFAYAAA
jgi:hypothetical protein